MVKIILIKSPDEWATTKQACRDELVVYCVFPPTLYTSLYSDVLSTVLRKSNFTLYTRSKFRLVGHSTTFRNGKIQHQLLNQEYSFTITQGLPSTTHRKDRAVFTQNALESPLLSQPRHDRTSDKGPINQILHFIYIYIYIVIINFFRGTSFCLSFSSERIKWQTERIRSQQVLLVGLWAVSRTCSIKRKTRQKVT